MNKQITMLSGVWGAGNYLFFKTGYRKDYEEQTTLDLYTTVLNLEDGSVRNTEEPLIN